MNQTTKHIARMEHTSTFEVRHFIDDAVARTGLSLDQLSARLDYRSLHRVRAGEFPLPAAKRLHIRDLIRLSELESLARDGFDSPRVNESPSQPMQIPHEIAILPTPVLVEQLREMLATFNTVPKPFADTARNQILATFEEWKKRTGSGITYS